MIERLRRWLRRDTSDDAASELLKAKNRAELWYTQWRYTQAANAELRQRLRVFEAREAARIAARKARGR